MSIETTLQQAAEFVSSEFNLNLERTQLKQYSTRDWQTFCQLNAFEADSEGLYVPESYTAYIHPSLYLISNAFHEYFGHGLFCEHSEIGKPLPNLSKPKADRYLYDKNNQLLGLSTTNIGNYEGFAMWLESLLCKETGNENVWKEKLEATPDPYVQLYNHFMETETNLTRFGFMAQMGFPKHYDNETITNLIRKYYQENFNNIDFIVLYGSQKPESDIDLFIVSGDESRTYFNGWLDIYQLQRKQFGNLLGLLDISVTDPLFSGTLIYGNKNYFEELKTEVKNHPITPYAISHNIQESQRQESYLESVKHTQRDYELCLSYIDSFRKNAEQLTKGNKILTLKSLPRTEYN